MNRGDKVTTLYAPELIDKPWSRREAWRVFAIIAEFAEATGRLNGVRIDRPPEVVEATFDHYEKCGFEPFAQGREARLDL